MNFSFASCLSLKTSTPASNKIGKDSERSRTRALNLVPISVGRNISLNTQDLLCKCGSCQKFWSMFLQELLNASRSMWSARSVSGTSFLPGVFPTGSSTVWSPMSPSQTKRPTPPRPEESMSAYCDVISTKWVHHRARNFPPGG